MTEALPQGNPAAGNVAAAPLNPEIAELNLAASAVLAEAERITPALDATNTPGDRIYIAGNHLRHIVETSVPGAEIPARWTTGINEGVIYKNTDDPTKKWVRVDRNRDGTLGGAIVQGASDVRPLTEAEAIRAANDIVGKMGNQLTDRLRRFEDQGGTLEKPEEDDLGDILDA